MINVKVKASANIYVKIHLSIFLLFYHKKAKLCQINILIKK